MLKKIFRCTWCRRWMMIPMLLLAGCITESPLYTVKDLINVPELEGEWQMISLDTTNKWVLKKQGEKDYLLLEHTHNHTSFGYIARFLKLSDQLFVDLQMADIDTYKVKAGGHMIAKVSTDSSGLQIALFNSDYLVGLAKKNKIQLTYKTSNTSIADYGGSTSYYVSEPTEKLQKLIITYMNDTNVFAVDNEAIRFKRKKK